MSVTHAPSAAVDTDTTYCTMRDCPRPAAEVVTLGVVVPSLRRRREFRTGWCEGHKLTNATLVGACVLLQAGGFLKPDIAVEGVGHLTSRVYA